MAKSLIHINSLKKKRKRRKDKNLVKVNLIKRKTAQLEILFMAKYRIKNCS